MVAEKEGRRKGGRKGISKLGEWFSQNEVRKIVISNYELEEKELKKTVPLQ